MGFEKLWKGAGEIEEGEGGGENSSLADRDGLG